VGLNNQYTQKWEKAERQRKITTAIPLTFSFTQYGV
jgi:hypothetical protein